MFSESERAPDWSRIRLILVGGLLVSGSLTGFFLIGTQRVLSSGQWLAIVLGIGVAGGVFLGLGLPRSLANARNTSAPQFGQYTLERRIGQGGMGSVYRANHALLKRPTAIKLMHPSQSEGDRSLERFEREVQITSLLTHPNTIALYDYGHTPAGQFYYAMEYLQGVTLQDLVEVCGPLPPDRVIFILQQLCGSLQEAHSFLLIHRDIKPANIMLCERGGLYDFVKVLDFGLVKASAGARETDTHRLTGTAYYIAPEGFSGSARLGSTSDLYSLGAVAYFLLTGGPPFEGSTVFEVGAKHLSEDPRRLSTYGIVVSDALESTVRKCLEKKPGDRHQSADEVRSALGQCPEGGSWNSERAQRWWDKEGEAVFAASSRRRAEHAETDEA